MTGNEDEDRLTPAQSSHANLPHVEAIVPLDAPTAPPEPPAVYLDVPTKVGAGLVLAIGLGIILLAAVVIGFVIWPKPPVETGPPLTPGTTRLSIPGSTPGETAAIIRSKAGGSGGNAKTAASNPAPGMKPPAGDRALAAYNEKLAGVRRLLSQASTEFASQTDTLSAEPDINTAMDKAAEMWDTWARGIATGAANLESISPPAQVASIHAKYTDNIRQLAVLAEQASQAASAHDQTLLDDIRSRIETLESTTGLELTNMITSAGYDSARFDKDGTLVKRSP